MKCQRPSQRARPRLRPVRLRTSGQLKPASWPAGRLLTKHGTESVQISDEIRCVVAPASFQNRPGLFSGSPQSLMPTQMDSHDRRHERRRCRRRYYMAGSLPSILARLVNDCCCRLPPPAVQWECSSASVHSKATPSFRMQIFIMLFF